MQSLLTPARRPDSPAGTRDRRAIEAARPAQARGAAHLRMPDWPGNAFMRVADELKAHGIIAEPEEIAAAVLAALARRPDLCQGLVAAHLLEDRPA